MRLSRGRRRPTSSSSSVAVAVARLGRWVIAGAAAVGSPETRAAGLAHSGYRITEIRFKLPLSEHSELQSCRFRHHRRVPDRVPDHLDLGRGDPRHALDPVLHLPRQRAGDRTGWRGQGHLDLHLPVGLDVEVVDEAHLVDVDRDLGVVDRLQRFDDVLFDEALKTVYDPEIPVNIYE